MFTGTHRPGARRPGALAPKSRRFAFPARWADDPEPGRAPLFGPRRIGSQFETLEREGGAHGGPHQGVGAERPG